MAKGVTVTSSIITISGSTSETIVNTFEQETVPLSLDILSREVLLIYAVDINTSTPDGLASTNTSVHASLSTTSRTAVGNIGATNVFAEGQMLIRAAGYADGGVGFSHVSPETPTANALDYVAIVSTNDFFIQVQGQNNLTTKGCSWRVWCARAKVTADIYAALVQGEQLSA